MTDDTGPEPGGAPEDDGGLGNEVSAALAKLEGGERLAVIGAGVVLIVWALFDLLLDEYGTGHLPFALGVVAVWATYAHQKGKGIAAIPHRTVLYVTAGLLGLLGVTDLVEELRNNILEADATTVIGALGYYAGSIMAGVGALQLRKP